MTSTSSSDLNEQLSKQIENTADSNSESDISDNWAVIDEDSSLEWNNEIKYEFRRPRPTSRNEQSDEESIEVVPEDSDTGFLPGKCVENDPDILLPPLKEEKSTNNEDIHTGTSISHVPGDLDQETNDQKRFKENYPILFGLITGVFAVSFLWMLHVEKLENSTSITSARALVTKLQYENQFLRSELRFVYSSLRSALSKTNKTGSFSRSKEQITSSNHSFPTSIYDYVLSSQENSPEDYCLASGDVAKSDMKITNNEERLTWTEKTDSTEPIGVPLGTLTTINEPKAPGNENETCFEESETYSELHNDVPLRNTIPVHHMANLGIPAVEMRTSKEDEYSTLDEESLTDPRPPTKFRNSVEKIYALTLLLGDESRMTVPPKSQLLNTLAQDVEVLDSLLDGNVNVHDNIANLKIEIQNSTRILLDFIDQSISNLVEIIASEVKKSKSKIQTEFCNLKTKFENDNIALLNWQGKPIIQDCSKLKENNTKEYKNEINDFLKPITNRDMEGSEANLDEVPYIAKEGDRPLMNTLGNDLLTNQDFKQEGHSLETKDINDGGDSVYRTSENIDGTTRNSPKVKTYKLNAYPEKHKARASKERSKKGDLKVKKSKNCKSKQINEEKKRKRNESKLVSKKSKEQMKIKDRANLDRKKKNHKKEKYLEYNLRNDKKFKFNKRESDKANNVSGEWSIKLANGRAEQRRRGQESNWVFDRAQSRNLNREKSKEDKQESCWFYGQEHNQ